MLKMLFMVLIACLNVICNDGQPAKEMPVAEAGNLKYTFGSQEEIPAAFFQTRPQPPERRVYPPCQDGSGGLCVEAGQCPPNLRPERNNTNACGPGLECCFGPAANDKSCASRGGQCTSKSACGRSPTFSEAVDCDSKKGEVCCIFI